MSTYRKGQKEDPGNCRPVSLVSVPERTMEQVLKKAISMQTHFKNLNVKSQHGQTEGSILFDQKSCSVDERKVVDIIINLLFTKCLTQSPSKSFLTSQKDTVWADETQMAEELTKLLSSEAQKLKGSKSCWQLGTN